MTSWIFWRLLKWLGVTLFVGGIAGSATAPRRSRRLWLLYTGAVPGLCGTWSAGWMLMKQSGRAITAPWILAALAASFLALHLAFLASHKPAPRPITPALALGAMLASIALMTARGAATPVLAAVAGAALAAGAVLSWWWRPTAAPHAETADLAVLRRGFRWVAWAEGASLLLMVGISMPLRALAGVDLDGDSGLIGWTHGVLVLVYLQALSSTSRALGWGWGRWAWGVLASLLPGGTFLFDRWP